MVAIPHIPPHCSLSLHLVRPVPIYPYLSLSHQSPPVTTSCTSAGPPSTSRQPRHLLCRRCTWNGVCIDVYNRQMGASQQWSHKCVYYIPSMCMQNNQIDMHSHDMTRPCPSSPPRCLNSNWSRSGYQSPRNVHPRSSRMDLVVAIGIPPSSLRTEGW